MVKIHGNGSIVALEPNPRHRCRKWRLYVSTDCGQKTRVFNGTWTAACKALEAFKTELAAQVSTNETFAAYAASWLLWREKSGNFAPGTIENNRREIAALNRSDLASLELSTITPETCRDALLWIKLHPVRKSGELTNTSMNKIFVTLNQIFSQAVDDGRMAANPMSKIKPPKPDTPEKRPLEPDELMRFVDDLRALPLDGRTMALYLMALLGLRRGEACAVYVDDIDANLLTVHRAIKERNGAIGRPKSKAANRTLPIPPMLRELITTWTNTRPHDAPTLCCNTRGGVLIPQNLDRWWRGDAYHNGVRDVLGYPDMTLHQLRHSNLNMVSRYLSPFDLQRYAGWSSIEPARVYIHDSLYELERAIAACYSVQTSCKIPHEICHDSPIIRTFASTEIGTPPQNTRSDGLNTQVAGSNPVHPTSDYRRSTP